MRVVSIVGARPQFIKLGPIAEAIGNPDETAAAEAVEHVIVHTGQHYDRGLSEVFFEELALPQPDAHLEIGSGPQGEQTARMLVACEQVLVRYEPDLVLVYGDTNSTLAGSLAAAKLHIPVAHIESGLRSRNKTMPEEINRVLCDHVSTFLFCPTGTAVRNLANEGYTEPINEGHRIPLDYEDFGPPAGVDRPWVVHVGDVMKDALLRQVQRARAPVDVLAPLALTAKEYAVATVHRAENTDDAGRLHSIFRALDRVAGEILPVILPMHPRTRKAVDALGVTVTSKQFARIEPVSYRDMLTLVANARLVLTDSGGLQKEAFLLGVPCVTLREETEWIELVDAGWNRLAGAGEDAIVSHVEGLLAEEAPTEKPDLYGDGCAAARIVHVCSEWWRRVRA